MRISGFAGKYKWFLGVFEDMFQTIADSIAAIVGHVMESDGALLGLLVALFISTQVALIGLVPTIFGSIVFSIFAGISIGKLYVYDPTPDMDHMDHAVSDSTPVVETELVPYDKWPDECYVCRDDIPNDMEIRGQFVIHKGESEAETKAVPLCEECTWTHSTLVDNHDTLVKIYDERTEPTEI